MASEETCPVARAANLDELTAEHRGRLMELGCKDCEGAPTRCYYRHGTGMLRLECGSCKRALLLVAVAGDGG